MFNAQKLRFGTVPGLGQLGVYSRGVIEVYILDGGEFGFDLRFLLLVNSRGGDVRVDGSDHWGGFGFEVVNPVASVEIPPLLRRGCDLRPECALDTFQRALGARFRFVKNGYHGRGVGGEFVCDGGDDCFGAGFGDFEVGGHGGAVDFGFNGGDDFGGVRFEVIELDVGLGVGVG